MSAILDYLSSVMIGGIVIIMALNALDTKQKYFFAHTDDIIVQQSLTSISRTLEGDLRKMGFAVPEGDDIIIQADSLNLIFRGDIDRNWSIDQIHYYVGPLSEANFTPNPRDRFLYRKVNGQPSAGFIVGLVSNFRFDYLNQDGQLVDVSNPSNYSAIKMIRITLRVENQAVYSAEANPDISEYETAFWQQTRLVSRNLRR